MALSSRKWCTCIVHVFRSQQWLKSENESFSHLIVSDSLQPHGLQLARLLCPWNSSGKNTRVGSHSLLQGIFLIQWSNSGLLHCRQILYHLSHQRSPLEEKKLVLFKVSLFPQGEIWWSGLRDKTSKSWGVQIKMAKEEDPVLTSFHGQTKTTTKYKKNNFWGRPED